MDTCLYWKKIWFTLTTQSKLTTQTNIQNVLDLVKEDLCIGIGQFKGYSKKSFEEWKANIYNAKENTTLTQLVKRISKVLNLEAAMAWKIFCNFLMYEYYGTIQDIEHTADFEISNTALFEQLWLFYSSERMYIIKSLKYIIESCLNEKHKYYNLYVDFVTGFKFDRFRNCLFKQFQSLLNEITADNSSNCNDFKDWINRNIQEQFEILDCIILSEDFLPLSIGEFKELFSIFKEHNFTHDPSYYGILEYANPEDLKTIRRLEIMTLLVGLNSCWESSRVWKLHIAEIETLLMSAMYQGELCIILLAWTTLQMTLPSDVALEKFSSYYNKFTKAALKEKVFVLMYQIVSDPTIQACSAFPIIQKTLYNLLDFVCNNFDQEGSIIKHEGIIQLCIELIKNPEVADKFLNDDGEKASIVYKIIYDMFPYSFVSYSEIVLQLLQHENLVEKVVTAINNFPHYTEEYTEPFRDTVVTLMGPYFPSDNISVGAHSEAQIFSKFGKTFVKYEAYYSYFMLMQDKASQTILKKHFPEGSLREMELSYEIVGTVIKQCSLKDDVIKTILDDVGNVLLSVSKRPFVCYELMKVCLDVFVVLMKSHSEQIIEMLVPNNFLPYLTKSPHDVNNYFDKNFLKPNIFLLAIEDQLNYGEYDILFSYIKLLQNTPETNQNMLRIKIPGMVFLLLHFFPIHLDTAYSQIQKKYELTLICLEYLVKILYSYHDERNEYDKVIYDFCYGVVVNYEPTITVFLSLFRSSNTFLHIRMLKEINWKNGATFTIINSIKACMNIFMRIFTLHNTNERCLHGTNFFNSFFNIAFKPSSLKILMGYLNFAFDPAIQKMACRLFQKIAANATVPILALLEMNHYQIQCTFLEKLRDPLENENTKITILELITLCIEKQNGLTAAFFDLRRHASKKYDGSLTGGDSVISFMEEYLENISKSSTYLNSPVQATVLDLFHTLWMYRKDILIQQLTQSEHFWLTLTDPLFQDLRLPNKTYSQIFNILTFELFRSKGNNDKINDVFDKLFSKDNIFTRAWCDHIIIALDEKTIATYGNNLLRSWKNLIMSIELTYPKCLEELKIREMLTETCVYGLIQHFTFPDDIRILTNWAELYLFLIKRWSKNYFKDYKEIFSTLTRVFTQLGEYYDNVSGTFKEIMLSIAIQTLEDLRGFAPINHMLVEEYIVSVGNIFDKEYMKIVTEETRRIDEKAYNEWLLLLIFANNLILMDFVESHATWFGLTRFGHKVITSMGLFTANPIFFPIAKIAVQCLINYAKTKMISEFLDINFEPFFDSTRPPKRYIYTEALTYKNAIPWYFEEWWLTYMGIIQLMTTLLKRIHSYKLNMLFKFVSIHEDVIKSVLKLPRVTAEKTALQLTSACLNFCYKLLPWREEWKANQPNVYFSIVNSIYETINSVTCIFLRPRILKFFTIEKGESQLSLLASIPIDIVVNTMDELMRIVTLSCLCLLRAGPNILLLMQPPIKGNCVNDVEIDFDFHIPQVHEEFPQRVTYGTILCLLHFLCKSITYIHAQKLTAQKKTDETKQETSDIISLAFVCPDYAGGYTISERFSSLSSEISSLSAPWLMKLNLTNVTFAMETLGSLIAAQTYISFNINEMRSDLKQYFQRELCSELMFFYEFTRKRSIDANQYRIVENMVYRKYTVWKLPYAINLDENDPNISFVKKTEEISLPLPSDEDEFNLSYVKEDLRNCSSILDCSISDPNVFFSRRDFVKVTANTTGSSGDASAEISKMLSPILSKTSIRNVKKVCYGERVLHGEVSKVPLDKVLLKYPKPPKIKDGDYLLCLTHWLMCFCELSH